MGETTGKVGPLKDITSSLEPGESVTITPRSHLDAGTEGSSATTSTLGSHSNVSSQGSSATITPASHVGVGTELGSGPVTPQSHKDTGSEGGDEAAQIRSGIENTRADLSQTINALQEKLDPSHIAEQVKEQIREKATEAFDSAKHSVKEATIGKAEKIVASVSDSVSGVISGPAGTAVKETSSSVVQYIRENPIPIALVSIGIGMLTFGGRKKSSYSYRAGIQPSRYDRSEVIDLQTGQSSFTERAKDAFSGVAETTRGAANTAAEKAKDTFSGVAETTREAAGTVAEKARLAAEQATGAVTSVASTVKGAAGTAADTTRRQLHDVNDQARQGIRVANERFKSTLQSNPMALGIAALATGALVGLTLPTTQVEAEYMGDARDRLMDQAKSAAQEATKKIQHVAEEAGQSLKEVAQREGLTTDKG